MRWLAGPLLMASLVLLPACAAHRLSERDGVTHPIEDDFFDFPAKYRGRIVRLPDLFTARVEMVRPLVFTAPRHGDTEVVVSDARSLARVEHLRPGETVTLLIECTEGRTDRGNLLLAIERSGPLPAAPPPQG